MGRHHVWTENSLHPTHILLQSQVCWWADSDFLVLRATLQIGMQAFASATVGKATEPSENHWFSLLEISSFKKKDTYPVSSSGSSVCASISEKKLLRLQGRTCIQLIAFQLCPVFKLQMCLWNSSCLFTPMVLNKAQSNLIRGSLSFRYLN